MDGLITENVIVLIYWLDKVEYVLKGRQGYHNNQLSKNCNHEEDQRAPFNAKVDGEKFSLLQSSSWRLMAPLQWQIFLPILKQCNII